MTSTVTIRDLLEAGAHYGHLTRYWQPKMAQYIFGSRNNVHIINLELTLQAIVRVQDLVRESGRKGHNILFVGTKKAAKNAIQAGAEKINQPFVSKRWLGGILTNYKTIRMSIKRLEDLEYEKKTNNFSEFTKKEALMKGRDIKRLQLNIGGIKNMQGLPDAMFVLDVNYESVAVAEARKLGIPIIAVVDTNSNPDFADYVIPGNDDSTKAIELYMKAITDAYSEGQELYKKAQVAEAVEAPKTAQPKKNSK